MIFLHKPCIKDRGDWAIDNADFKLYLDPILRSYKYVSKKIPKKNCIRSRYMEVRMRVR